MDKLILSIDDYDKIVSIETEEEANKYLYDAKVVKKISEDSYKNGVKDAIYIFKSLRKKNIVSIEGGQTLFMEGKKRQINWAAVGAIGTAVAGFAGGALSLYQLHLLRKQAKAEVAELENKDHK